MPTAPGPIRKAWYQWKMKRFPWRKKWLVGFDLHGNTYWEFKDALHALRNRRIAQYHRSTHFGDVNVSPSWMQWLRHTRHDPPTIAEQQMDIQRQERMKTLAARADARWAAQPSALDAPEKQQPAQMLQSRDPDSGVVQTNISLEANKRAEALPQESGRYEGEGQRFALIQEAIGEKDKKGKGSKEEKASPWNTASQPQDWQPAGWTPAPAKRSA